jgi:hypothetical protein
MVSRVIVGCRSNRACGPGIIGFSSGLQSK